MSTTQNPITGRSSGKYGPAVFTTWKGLNVMKTNPETVSNPQTQGQIDQRDKFSLIQSLCSLALSALKDGYRDAAIKMSEYNLAMKNNLAVAIKGTSGNFAVDIPKIVFSAGTLVNKVGLSIINNSHLAFEVGWTSNAGEGNALASDEAHVVILRGNSGVIDRSVYIDLGTTRAEESESKVLPSDWVGFDAYVYIFFYSADGTLISDTLYGGSALVS